MAAPNSRSPSAEARQRAILASTLERRCDDIVARWLAQVQASLALDDQGGRVEAAQLRDGIPDYLRSVARS